MNYGQNHSAENTEQRANQQVMAQADVTLDQTGRLQLYNQAEQKIVNELLDSSLPEQLHLCAKTLRGRYGQ